MATVKIFPTSDYLVSSDDWTGSDAGEENFYSYIDEEEASDTDYIYTTEVGDTSYSAYFNFSSTGIPAGSTINSVDIYIRDKISNTKQGSNWSFRAYINSTYYYFGDLGTWTAGTAFDIDTSDITTNPYTETTFTIEELNNLIAGVDIYDESDDGRIASISQLYIEIDYTEGTSTTTTSSSTSTTSTTTSSTSVSTTTTSSSTTTTSSSSSSTSTTSSSSSTTTTSSSSSSSSSSSTIMYEPEIDIINEKKVRGGEVFYY